MLVCGYIRIYLVVYGPEIIGGFGLEKKTKAVCGLERTNYGCLRNARPPIIDPQGSLTCTADNGLHGECGQRGSCFHWLVIAE